MKKMLLTAGLISASVMLLCGCSEGKGSSQSEADDTLSSTSETEEKTEVSAAKEVSDTLALYFSGYNNSEPEKIAEVLAPGAYLELMKENGEYDGLIEQISSNIEATGEYWAETFGENSAVESGIFTENEPLSSELLDCAEVYMLYMYDEYEYELDIEEGVEVEFEYSVTGDSDSMSGYQKACLVNVKDDGWKLITLDAESLSNFTDLDELKQAEAQE